MRPREANSPEAPELTRGRVGWEPQFFRPAAKAGDPHPTQLRAVSPEPSALEDSPGPGFRGWGEAAAVLMWGPSQVWLRGPALRPVWAWERACSPATPVPRGPWVGPPIWAGAWSGFSLCPGGRGQGEWASVSHCLA